MISGILATCALLFGAVDLSGDWLVAGTNFSGHAYLPGTLADAQLGKRWTERDFQTTMDLPQSEALVQEWQYAGNAVWRRTIELTTEDCAWPQELFLERVMWTSAAFAMTWPDFMRDSNGTDPDQLVRRAIDWHLKSGILIAPDGSKGMYEGVLSNTFGYRKGLRGDCHFLTAALFACAGRRYCNPEWTKIGTNLADFSLSRGFQTEDGFIRWFDRDEKGDCGHTVYSSDMGRSALALVNIYKVTGDAKYLAAAKRAADAFLMWMDGRGLNSGWFDHVDAQGWKGRGTSDNPVFYAEMISFLLQLDEKKYTDAALETLDKIGAKFPDVVPFGFSDNFTYSRYLLMLACVQRATNRDLSERINRTLKFFTKNVHCTGGIEETPIRLIDDGEAGVGVGDGSDHITDILYCDYVTLNALSVLMKLPAGRVGTIDRTSVRKLYAGLRAFLMKIQIASDDPRFDGAWMRAYDMEIGEFYGLDKDKDWGAYCIEAGWVTGFIPLVFLYEEGDDSFFFRTDLKTHNEKEE